MQAEVRVAVDVAADPVTVWHRALDWGGQGDWIPLTQVRHVAGPQQAVGTRLVARTGVGRLGFDDPMTITALDPPRTVELLHTGRVVKGTGAFRVAARTPHREDDTGAVGSRFEWWERVEVPGGPLAPALWWVAAPLTRLGFAVALRRFARAVEAEQAVSPASVTPRTPR